MCAQGSRRRGQERVLAGRQHQRERAGAVRRGHVVVAAIALDRERDRTTTPRGSAAKAACSPITCIRSTERRFGAGELAARRRDPGHRVGRLLLAASPAPRAAGSRARAGSAGVPVRWRRSGDSARGRCSGRAARTPIARGGRRRPGRTSTAAARPAGRSRAAAPPAGRRRGRAAATAAGRALELDDFVQRVQQQRRDRAAPAARRSASRGSGASAVRRRCRRRSRRGRWRRAIRAARPAGPTASGRGSAGGAGEWS